MNKKAIAMSVAVLALLTLFASCIGAYNYGIIGLTTGLTVLVVAALWLEATYFEAARWRTANIIMMSVGIALIGGVAWPLTGALIVVTRDLRHCPFIDYGDEGDGGDEEPSA